MRRWKKYARGRKELFLSLRDINDADIQSLKKAIEKSTFVYLCDNKITHVGASIIADAMENSKTIKGLWLGYNQLRDAGVSAIASAMGRMALEEIYLYSNQITDVGASVVATAIEHSATLRVVWLSDNQIGDVGAEALARAIAKSKSLKEMNLNMNLITDVGCCAIDRSTSVERVTIWNNFSTKIGSESVENAWHRQRVLTIASAFKGDGDHAIMWRVYSMNCSTRVPIA